MKINYILVIPVFLLAAGCSGNRNTGQETKTTEKTAPAAEKKPLSLDNETTLLLKDLEENGDYVNSQNFPSLIKASIVHEELGKKNLIIDLRPAELFSKGHIKGAVSKKFSDLPGYLRPVSNPLSTKG